MNFTEKAAGKWPQIHAEFGVPDEAMRKKSHCPCPSQQAEKRSNGQQPFRYSDKEGRGNFFCECNPDGRGGGLKLVECMTGLSWRDAMTEIEKRGIVDGEYVPKPVLPIPELIREIRVKESQYLRSRGLNTPPTLKWGFRSENGRLWPVMAADIQRDDGFVTGRHFTFLENGKKRQESDGCPARRIVKRDPEGELAGGAVRLMPHGRVLGVGEGIETALAAHQLSGEPVWAVLNTALMKAFVIPEGVEHLIIFADHDRGFAGQAAAYALAARAHARKIKVTVEIPTRAGDDWNDVLLQQLKERAA